MSGIVPFAVRVKEGTKIAQCGETTFYQRLNDGTYETFLDGTMRMVVVESILAHQRRQLAAARGTPRDNPSPRSAGGGPKRRAKKTERKTKTDTAA